MPLAEAAFASGFADQSHMTRVFVRKYGLSPRLYAGAFV
jgi:AraC-like DNA-binding protein